ncbi:MAG: PEP-CTERM sorting domain-containing protein [Opitutaceae bacterium]|nr:PEP-CTERM sorting domain-containing protein [Opitutaceae bacterium]
MNNILPAFILGVLLLAGVAPAQVVSLRFTGTVNTNGQTIFGQTGSAVPYDFSISYDTSVDSALVYTVLEGSTWTGSSDTAGHNWYGYSAAGLSSVNLNFGTGTWSQSDLEIDMPPSSGYDAASLWFDTNIADATPTRAWMSFYKAGLGALDFGLSQAIGYVISIELGYADIYDATSGKLAYSSNLTISSIPEPATTVLLLGLAAVGVAGLHRWRRQRRRH